jgi:hypothetical protein
MGLQFIDNQPIIYDNQLDTYSPCKKNNCIECSYYTPDDYLFAQWKQTPCDDTNRFCNPTFEQLGSNLVTNGTFDTGTTGWTLFFGSSYDAVNDRVNFISGSNIEQTIGTLVTGQKYTIRATIGGGNGTGTVGFYMGGTLFGTSQATTNTEVVEFTGVKGAANNKLDIGGTWTGWVDNIEVFIYFPYDVNNKWLQYYTGTNFNFIAGSATHIPGNGDVLYQQSTDCAGQVVGGYYKIKFKVTGLTAGSIYVLDYAYMAPSLTWFAPTSYLLEITADGVYEVYTGVNTFLQTVFSFTPDSNGSISDLELIAYSNFHTLILKNISTGTNYYISSSLEYYQDWITLRYPLTGKPAGEYQLCITDACGYNYGQSLTTDPSFLTPLGTAWAYIPEYGDVATYGITGGKFQLIAATPTGVPYVAWRLKDQLLAYQTYPAGLRTGTFNWSITLGKADVPLKVQLWLPSASTTPFLLTAAQAQTTYTGTVTIQFPNGPTSNDYMVRFNTFGNGTVGNGSTFEILDFNLDLVSYYPGQATEYCSECIYIDTDADCRKWVAGTNGEDAYGFHFDPSQTPPFQIGARVKSMLINPKYPGDLKRYEDSEGNITVTKGKSGKVYTLFIDYTDEHTHDWLRLAVLSDTVIIDSKNYVGTEGDYEPEWPDNLGNYNMAQARVEVQHKIDPLFNNNAG